MRVVGYISVLEAFSRRFGAQGGVFEARETNGAAPYYPKLQASSISQHWREELASQEWINRCYLSNEL